MSEIYLITGATSDIAVSLIKKLDESNSDATVVGICRKQDNLLDLKEELTSVDLLSFECDLANRSEVSSLLDGLESKNLFPTHILHLAAPAFEYVRFKVLTLDRLDLELEVELTSLVKILTWALPHMVRSRFGRVVVMLSAYTIGVPPAYMSAYIMAKYALLGLVRSLASEYTSKGITINGISPNMINTKFLKYIDERVVEETAKHSSLKRNLEADEVASAIIYLFSRDASCISGHNLALTGADRI